MLKEAEAQEAKNKRASLQGRAAQHLHGKIVEAEAELVRQEQAQQIAGLEAENRRLLKEAKAQEAENKRASLQGRAAMALHHKALAEGDAMIRQEESEQNAELEVRQLALPCPAQRPFLPTGRHTPWMATDNTTVPRSRSTDVKHF